MQNNIRFWLKGGGYLCLIHMIISIMLFFLYFTYYHTETRIPISLISGFIYLFIINLPGSVISPYLGIYSVYPVTNFEIFSVYIFSAVVYFIVGALFGLIYGKIVNRDKTTPQAR